MLFENIFWDFLGRFFNLNLKSFRWRFFETFWLHVDLLRRNLGLRFPSFLLHHHLLVFERIQVTSMDGLLLADCLFTWQLFNGPCGRLAIRRIIVYRLSQWTLILRHLVEHTFSGLVFELENNWILRLFHPLRFRCLRRWLESVLLLVLWLYDFDRFRLVYLVLLVHLCRLLGLFWFGLNLSGRLGLLCLLDNSIDWFDRVLDLLWIELSFFVFNDWLFLFRLRFWVWFTNFVRWRDWLSNRLHCRVCQRLSHSLVNRGLVIMKRLFDLLDRLVDMQCLVLCLWQSGFFNAHITQVKLRDHVLEFGVVARVMNFRWERLVKWLLFWKFTFRPWLRTFLFIQTFIHLNLCWWLFDNFFLLLQLLNLLL